MADESRGREATPDAIDVSVVLPCLNEADTIGACVENARQGLRAAGVSGEIVVADNGSSDGSPELASSLGAAVVRVAEKGYGHALAGGIEAARGTFIIMGDADGSYDFGEMPKFVSLLRDGADLVQGCRRPSGGGKIAPGAMPWSHRVIGNPLFTLLARWWFRAPIHDVYCGLRGFRKDLYRRLDLRCGGMEFATEMIIKASLSGAHIEEVPITLHRDGRVSHLPHLKTMRDGWRTLRFFLMLSPRWLFLVPGLAMVLAGILGYAVGMLGVTVRGITFDVHTVLVASLAILCGYQCLLFAVFSKTFVMVVGLIPEDRWLARLFRVANLERGLVMSLLAVAAGLGLLIGAVGQWAEVGFAHLDYAHTMRWVIPGSTLTALGVQSAFASFFISILGMKRR